ncbi:MAG TPA: AAA family ATPase [Thermoguttaceae bacterium]|nr:AAA family ATPase [Thermoguttaceae bacterium]
MEGSRLLRTLRLTNFLSYGPEGTEIELEPLNVLIGPNACGKSNLLEAISLLKAAPSDISAPIVAGGGMPEWAWKGARPLDAIDLEIGTIVFTRKDWPNLDYRFRLASVGQQVHVVEESIRQTKRIRPARRRDPHLYVQGERGAELLRFAGLDNDGTPKYDPEPLRPADIDPRRSILSQRKDPDHYPELSFLGRALREIELFRACNLGHESPLRGPQRADLTSYFLLEDGRNLGLVLSNMLLDFPPAKKRLLAEMRRFCEYIEDITTRIVAGTVEMSIHERGFRQSTPSTRLSDGTLRYLCLLTILCHPSPPPLVCIEDPEIGLHPDILPNVAELLVEASRRMQLVVTTHSDVLVSALSSVPEAVLVCERDDSGSHLKRLEPDRLKEWLEKYSLGELWRMGETGGNP